MRDRSSYENNLEQCVDPSCHDRPSTYEHKGDKPPPPDRSEIGRANWLLLHNVAAHFPLQPCEMEVLRMRAWLYAHSRLFPCHICRDELIDLYKKHQPVATNRIEMSLFVSKIHDMVNEYLGKKVMKHGAEDLIHLYY